MNLLLDTHAFLWFISGDSRLSASWRNALCDRENEVYLSVVSIWEATVKFQLGKLLLPQSPEVYLPAQRLRHGISSLSLDEPSVARLTSLPTHHRDPFDCMLICQAMEYRLTLVSADSLVIQYGVPVLA